MATFVDQREDEDVEGEELTSLEETPEQEQPQQEPESDIPEKYQGKPLEEIVRMHQEAEKLLGRQSSEVGELRKTVDTYIQTQLSQQQEAPQKSEDDDYDFFTDP